jgi:hypothetical protein
LRLILTADEKAIERPDFFYVVNSDAMLKLDATWPYYPGVGGFSMHAPKSRNFIVCFNFCGGWRANSIELARTKGVVIWKGLGDWDRLK